MSDAPDKQKPVELFFRAHVFCCTNQRPDDHSRGSCASKGSIKLRDYMKVRAKELGLSDVRINSSGCLDRCEDGPAMVIYPEGVWYSPKTREDIDEILQKHLLDGGRARTLLMAQPSGRDCSELNDDECENCGGC